MLIQVRYTDPRSLLFTARLHVPYATNNKDQGSVLAVHCTKTARKRCDVQHNQKLSR